jgi:hypothetical protein
MNSINKFSNYVIDYAERLSDMADAAEGKRKGMDMRPLILPAAGAVVFALVRSEAFTRQAKDVMEEAKSRASDLPDELLRRVRQTSQSSRRNGSQRTTSTASRPSSSRKTRSSSRARPSRSKTASTR